MNLAATQQLLPVAGAVMLLLTAGFVLFRALVSREQPLIWMLVLLIAMSLYLMAFHVNNFGSEPSWKWASRLRIPLALTLVPTFYLMIRSLVANSRPLLLLIALHYVLPLSMFGLAISPLFSGFATNVHPELFPYAGLVIMLQITAYLTLFLTRFTVLTNRIHVFIDGDEQKNNWLSGIFLWFSVLLIVLDTWLISFFFSIDKVPGLYALMLLVAVLMLTHQMVKLSYRALASHRQAHANEKLTVNEEPMPVISANQEKRFTGGASPVVDPGTNNTEPPDENPAGKEMLSARVKQELHRRITDHMALEEVLCDPSLSLKKLALDLQTNTRYLSLVINEFEQVSFPQYVNRLRVNLVINLMANPTNNAYTLYGLGQRAGFKSKSAFIEAFRQQTGTTPAEFLKKGC